MRISEKWRWQLAGLFWLALAVWAMFTDREVIHYVLAGLIVLVGERVVEVERKLGARPPMPPIPDSPEGGD